MTALTAADFADFHQEARGRAPFPWQADLVAEVLGSGRWPEVIDVPTGLGKTTLIDIAVFVAAATGCTPGSPGRRRTFFAIDRRIVVDEAYAHAKALAERIGDARGAPSVLGRVAAALDGLHQAPASARPLEITRMRGGITWEWRWLDRPDRPAVVIGTVDQLGSRLLFGGYGLNPRLRPIDAALTGVDSLVVVDEAHLAGPFVGTLRAVADTPMVGQLDLPAPIILTMSATPPAGDGRRVFPEAFRDAEVSPIAARRVGAKKRLHGVLVPAKVDPAPVLAEVAARLFDPDGDVTAVGVVCNTVQRARQVAERLRARGGLPVRLLTGRVRPADRAGVEEQLRADTGVDRDRSSADPVILVATQTIEVGANLDFDALVTESAPIDALVQRLGRLHRLGEPEAVTRTCVVVHHDAVQPLYGDARQATWDRLLLELGEVPTAGARVPELGPSIDASPGAMRALVAASDRSTLVVQPPDAPVLLPEVLGEWAATSNGEPITSRDPFLHGIREPDDDVSIVWRADLDDIDAGSWQLLVDRLPPMADEQLDVPIGAALRWLRGEPGAADVADAPGVEGRGDEVTDGVPTIRTEVLVWRGRGDGIVVDRASRLRTIRPGDVLVVPAVAGGCDGEGWFPTSTAAVPDLADEKGRSLRLHPATLPSFLGLPADEVAPVLDELWDSLQDDELDAIDAVATALAEVGLSDEGFVGTPDVLRGADGGVLGVYLDRPLDDAARRRMLGDGSVAQPDAAESSAAGASVALTVHHDAVAARARSIAQALRLPAVLAESVAVAAGAHDLGKWDPRFQVMLHAGDAAASKASLDGGRPLAKSGMRADDRTVARIAHRASGLPRGYRHEAGSVQAAGSVLERDDVDRDLVRHLIAAHHGNARPLLPAVLDEGAPFDADGIEVDPGRSVDFEHPRRFRELSDRYGHWGLAMLEAIVRLSDIGCSEEGS